MGNSLIKINPVDLLSISDSNYSYQLSEWKTLLSRERERERERERGWELRRAEESWSVCWRITLLMRPGRARPGQTGRNNNNSANIHIIYLLDWSTGPPPPSLYPGLLYKSLSALLAHNPFVQLREIIWERRRRWRGERREGASQAIIFHIYSAGKLPAKLRAVISLGKIF